MVSGMDNRIFNEIESFNPWLSNPEHPILPLEGYIPRIQAEPLLKAEWDDFITVITGPRQVGKTTLGKYLCREILRDKKRFNRLVYLNCDSPLIREWFSRVSVINELREAFGIDSFILFVDEVQRLENPGLIIKAIFDLKLPIKMIVTGSSQLEIKSKIQEYLTGRQIEALILPLGYQELPPPKYLEKKLLYGCYPQLVIQSSRKLLLSQLYRNYINKDIIHFLKIGKPTVFEKLMVLIAHSSGQLLNYQSLATDCGVSSVTVKNYIAVLEQTYVIKTVLPFVGNKRSEVTSNPKCYYLDNGFRNQALGNFSAIESRTDKGLLIESAVYQELYKHSSQYFLDYKIYFWRTKNGAEVDFVVQLNDQDIIPIEVKYQNFKQPKITRSFRSFIGVYQPKKAVIITKNFTSEIMIEQTKVIFVPFHRIEEVLRLVDSMVLSFSAM